MPRSKQKSAFTILEIILVIAALVIIFGLVIIAINPAKHFAELRNSERSADINAILSAVSQYSLDNNSTFPNGIEDNLRMIGTATTGCDIACGDSLIALDDDNSPIWGNLIVTANALEKIDNNKPALADINITTDILEMMIYPKKVLPGDTMSVSIKLKDATGINSVIADMGGIETIKLDLVAGDKFSGLWQAEWLVHSTVTKNYTTTFYITNNKGDLVDTTAHWSDPPVSSWISPDGHLTPTGQWTNAQRARDNNLTTYATNTFGQVGWGQYIYFTLNQAQYINRIGVIADYMDADLFEVDIDVRKNGVWTDVFQGGNEADWNAKWVEVGFDGGMIDQARFRYNYRQGGYHYWLYELKFYQTVETIENPTVHTLPATLIQDTRATVHGEINNDGGQPVSYYFEYGTTTSYGNTTDTFTGGTSGSTVSAFISGLNSSTNYNYRFVATNSSGTVYGDNLTFRTTMPLLGNIPPSTITDPDGTWSNTSLATDVNTSTYARSLHSINAPEWSSFLYFSQNASYTNGISFYARGLEEVNEVEIDIMIDGNWTRVKSGGFTGMQNNLISFEQALISQARIRFKAATINTGFFWQLHEFSFRKSSENTSTSCVPLDELVETYIADIPADPQTGSTERTNYAIKRLFDKRFVIYSCTPELGKKIMLLR